ncbi:four helix bundle protein [Paraburkholderia sp.]|uniref:four helix bundle protein n=1 Tax=Paraburkholderia sp. TaxID=1926495 RepID=UPI003C7CC39C
MAIHTDLPIHKTSCDLLGVAIEAAKHMPRDFKSTLGVEIRKECIAIVLLIARANATKDKVPHIERLLERVDVLQIVMRVCHEKRLVSPKIFADSIELIGSIGRQAGGWKKSASSPVASPSRR